jgi:DNA polymerase III subunit chi
VLNGLRTMTKVDFYTGSADKLRTACQLCNKAMQSNVRVVLSSLDSATIDTLDKLLWEVPATAFIPHARCDAEDAAQHPVVLCCNQDKFPFYELLISLHDEAPSFFSRFDRVIEIVGVDAEDSLRGRERFKYYRDRGYELSHTELSKTP